MKTPLVVAISSALTAAVILASVAVYSVFQRDNRSTIGESTTPASPTPSSSPASPLAQATPVAQLSPPPVITWTQAENDYLYDLSQALEPAEKNRTTPSEKLAIGRQIQGWLDGGADYWGVREKFDAAYKGSVVGNYAHNRDVYLKFATERLAPNHQDTLNLPPKVVKVPVPYPVPAPNNSEADEPFDGGNPIPEQAAIVIESGYLNCRAKPNGTIVGKVTEGQSIKVHRVAYRSGKAWYLTTQGCWVFGGGIRLEDANNPPTPNPPTPNPIPEREAIVIESGYLNCRAKPNGTIVGRVYEGDKIWVTKVDHSTGKPWYFTTGGCWVFGPGIELQ